MHLDIATHQARAYTVTTPVYQGPLDLLLQLIERAELDITKLALAQVTDQYLAYLEHLQERAAEEVSAFLVIAARLIQIKSEALLPRPPQREEGEEDPGEALAKQLLLYKRFKRIANFLAEREMTGLRTYLRLAPPPKVEGAVDLSGITLDDLAATARAVLLRPDDRRELKTVVTAPPVTIRQKIRLIAGLLRQRGQLSFRSMLKGAHSRLDIVVTFLAVLELIKRHFIQAQQSQLFGEIELQPSEAWDENVEFDLEFGE
jgi:segregation and condensation protein A